MVGSELGHNFHFSSIAEAKKCLKFEFLLYFWVLTDAEITLWGSFFQIKNAAFLFFFSKTLGSCEKFDTDGSLGNRKSNFFFLKKFFFPTKLKTFGFRQMARTAELPHVFAPVFHRNCNPSTKMTQKIFLFFPILSHKNSVPFQKIAKMKPQKVT